MIVYILLLLPTALIAYTIGSMDTLVLASNFVFHYNLRKLGTGGKWISNFRRMFGLKGAALLAATELIKDFIPIIIGSLLLAIKGHAEAGRAVAGLCLALGRLWPVFYSLKGSHATVAMIVAGLSIDASLGAAAAAVCLGMTIWTKRISLATFVGALAMAFASLLTVDDKILLYLALLTGMAVALKHIPAISRVLKGKEAKLTLTEDLSYKFDEKF